MTFLNTLFNFIIPSAYADTASATPPPGASNMSLVFMFAIFILFMYFVMWRPQSKRAKEHKELISALSKGDEVVTAGGMLGRVVKVTESYITLAVADTAEIIIQKSSISSVLPKGTLKSI